MRCRALYRARHDRAPPHPRHRHQPGHRRGDRRRARRPSRRRPSQRGRRRADRRRPRRRRAAPTALWWRGDGARSTGGSTCWSTMPACSRPRRSTSATPTGRRPGSGRCGSTCAPPPTSAGSPCSTSASAAAGGRIVNVASRAAYRGDSPDHWHYAASKARHGGDDQDDRPRLCRRGHLRLRGLPRLHRHRHGRGLSRKPRRPRLARRHPDRPAGDDAQEVAETVRWLALDAPASATGAVIDVNGASFVR